MFLVLQTCVSQAVTERGARGQALPACNLLSQNNHVSTRLLPSGGMLGVRYVDGLGLAKFRPALSLEKSYWEADPSDQSVVPWVTGGIGMSPPSKAHSPCPLVPGIHSLFPHPM